MILPALRLPLFVAASILLTGCAALNDHRTGLQEDGRLAPCSSAPRCVSSIDTGDRHAIAPLDWPDGLADDAADAWLTLWVESLPRTEVVERGDRYLRAESHTRFFTDDLELHWPRAGEPIDVRSSARLGWYDFRVNRNRVEALRSEMASPR